MGDRNVPVDRRMLEDVMAADDTVLNYRSGVFPELDDVDITARVEIKINCLFESKTRKYCDKS